MPLTTHHLSIDDVLEHHVLTTGHPFQLMQGLFALQRSISKGVKVLKVVAGWYMIESTEEDWSGWDGAQVDRYVAILEVRLGGLQ